MRCWTLFLLCLLALVALTTVEAISQAKLNRRFQTIQQQQHATDDTRATALVEEAADANESNEIVASLKALLEQKKVSKPERENEVDIARDIHPSTINKR